MIPEDEHAPLSMEHSEDLPTDRQPGGLYRHVRMSVRTANWLIVILMVVLIAVALFLIQHNGFTVSFDTNGGSAVASCQVLHGETVPLPETPTREGYRFTGWYLNRETTIPWDVSTDLVTDSFTLYAGWEKKSE